MRLDRQVAFGNLTYWQNVCRCYKTFETEHEPNN